MTELPIIFCDEHCVAINKPPGLLVHRTSLDSRATEFAMQLLRDQLQRLVYPVHRLDRATSGVLLFGLSSDAARVLTQQFEERSTNKRYRALVRGWCDDSGRIDLPLRDLVDERSRERKHGTERDAVTDFTTLARFELPFSDGLHPTSRYSLLELAPKTGRRHQLRRHLKHTSHPIVGDTAHGDHRHNKRFVQHFGLRRMCLAATDLEIRHPVSDAPLVLKAESGFESLLDELQQFLACPSSEL